MNQDNSISLTEVEWRLMHTLWTLEDPTFAQIMKEVSETGWSKQSVISFLKRLEIKGAIRRDTRFRPMRYVAIIRREDAVRAETDAVLERVYQGDPMLMMTSAVRRGKLNDHDIQYLIDLLKKGRSDTP